MKMKLMFLALATLAVACPAFADYTYQALFWQVDNTANYYGSDDNTYATLYATIGGDKICIDGRTVGTAKGQIKSEFVPAYSSYDFSSASFYVELLNESGATLATSTLSPFYSDLIAYMERNNSGSEAPSISSPYTYSFVIPEPTSAMLMLLGVAGLALKRKRRG